MQVNNLKIKYSKLYNKYQVITLDNKTVLEEFETEEQAINYAKQTQDFISKKTKEYQIIKNSVGKNFYAIAKKEDIKEYFKTGFLPTDKSMKFKKYLIELINKDKKYRNNVDFKTCFIN